MNIFEYEVPQKWVNEQERNEYFTQILHIFQHKLYENEDLRAKQIEWCHDMLLSFLPDLPPNHNQNKIPTNWELVISHVCDAIDFYKKGDISLSFLFATVNFAFETIGITIYKK